MNQSLATADAFLSALRSLPKQEQTAVLAGIVQDERFREDLINLGIFAYREEPSRNFEAFLVENEL
jgi:hypothetical protein